MLGGTPGPGVLCGVGGGGARSPLGAVHPVERGGGCCAGPQPNSPGDLGPPVPGFLPLPTAGCLHGCGHGPPGTGRPHKGIPTAPEPFGTVGRGWHKGSWWSPELSTGALGATSGLGHHGSATCDRPHLRPLCPLASSTAGCCHPARGTAPPQGHTGRFPSPKVP